MITGNSSSKKILRLGFSNHVAMPGGCPGFPDNHVFFQLSLFEHIAKMLGYRKGSG
jgi:hypothetical protein